MPLLNWVVTVVEFADAGTVVTVVGTSTTWVAGCTVVYSRVVVVSLVVTGRSVGGSRICSIGTADQTYSGSADEPDDQCIHIHKCFHLLLSDRQRFCTTRSVIDVFCQFTTGPIFR